MQRIKTSGVRISRVLVAAAATVFATSAAADSRMGPAVHDIGTVHDNECSQRAGPRTGAAGLLAHLACNRDNQRRKEQMWEHFERDWKDDFREHKCKPVSP